MPTFALNFGFKLKFKPKLGLEVSLNNTVLNRTYVIHLHRQLRLNSLALFLNRNHFTFRLDLPLKLFAKNLSFGSKPHFRSGLSFGLKL